PSHGTCWQHGRGAVWDDAGGSSLVTPTGRPRRASRCQVRRMDESLTPPMPMPAGGRLSEPRLKVLRELLGHRATGRTADELAAALEVSRNAVQQQLTALEGDGLVEVLELRSTGGRPSRAYTLTEAGMELFPR